MMEGVAQLGRVALALRDFSLAYACARRVLRYIEVQGPHSLEHPAMAYLTCYHILQANHKFEQARSVLGQGQAYVATQAGQIEDLLLRHTYLNNVSENRMIQELALGLRRPELQVENEE